MKLLRQLQSRIDRRSNIINDVEFAHQIDGYSHGLFLFELRREQTLDKRLYGELLRKIKQNKSLVGYIFNLEDKLYGKEKI